MGLFSFLGELFLIDILISESLNHSLVRFIQNV